MFFCSITFFLSSALIVEIHPQHNDEHGDQYAAQSGGNGQRESGLGKAVQYKGYPATAQQQVVHDTDRRVAGLDRQIAVPLIGVPGELLLDPSVGEGEIKADQGNGYSQQGGQEETKLKAVQ